MNFEIIEKISEIEHRVVQIKEQATLDAEAMVKKVREDSNREREELLRTEEAKSHVYLATFEKETTEKAENYQREADAILCRAREEADTHIKEATAIVTDCIMGG